MVTRKELIETAASVIKSKKVKGGLVGDVGCALETVSGNVCTRDDVEWYKQFGLPVYSVPEYLAMQ